MGTFDSLFGNQNAQRTQEATINGLMVGFNKGNRALDKGLTDASAYYDKSLTETDPLKQTYGKGVDMRANALGLNGAEGSQAALQAFQAGPQYQWNMDNTLQALGRSAAAAGRLNSGNTSLDFMKAAYGLSNGAWNDWLGQLGSYDGLASNTAQSRTNTLQGLGNLNYQTGNNKADLAWKMGQGIAQAGANAESSRDAGLGGLIGAGLNYATGTKLFG
ncbi:hypothetical protein GGQ86_004263 [Xanthobacter flavus]|uniref:Uncharacterized protein n=2 Tax=Xanthobacter flavus TaxID=281 RepID=A0A9W6FPP2_XANFL|nr:hypothetical protein [Xanthobacter flavus]MDR6335767.1 hypothetical protein [Xanthobacter flavus]GLI25757.1 hypothetical protein XFLAVUS301_54310 [Xanthobacter flavus]